MSAPRPFPPYGPLSVECPYCGRPVGAYCVPYRGWEPNVFRHEPPHPSRVAAWRRLAGGGR
jgi:hypothetical protein